MGFDHYKSPEISPDLPGAWRHEFPVTENLIYLNHAAVSPLCRRASDAIKWLSDDGLQWGSLHYDRWLAAYDGVRANTARLANCLPGEVAIVKNTSEGIATVALGLKWNMGDKVVVFREEFPSNYYIWQKLESWYGVRLEWLSCEASLDEIDRAADGAKLLAISFVQYLSGYRADLTAIGEICRRRGVFFFVDAIQGFGAFPFDVRAMNVQAFAADGHKWLLGPEGCGVLYVQQDWQDQIEPVEFGWTTVAGYTDYSSRDLALRRDAGRYECGTLNTIGCFGLRASMDLLLEVGVERISPHVQALCDRLALGAQAKGYEILGSRTPAAGAGILCVRKPGTDARLTHAALRERGILTAPRQGWVRMSPHFYISSADVDRVLDALP